MHRRRFLLLTACVELLWPIREGHFRTWPISRHKAAQTPPTQDPGSSCLLLQFRSDSFLLSSVSTLINARTWAWASQTMPSPVKLLYTDTDLPRFVFINLHLKLLDFNNVYAPRHIKCVGYINFLWLNTIWFTKFILSSYLERNVGFDIAKAKTQGWQCWHDRLTI